MLVESFSVGDPPFSASLGLTEGPPLKVGAGQCKENTTGNSPSRIKLNRIFVGRPVLVTFLV